MFFPRDLKPKQKSQNVGFCLQVKIRHLSVCSGLRVSSLLFVSSEMNLRTGGRASRYVLQLLRFRVPHAEGFHRDRLHALNFQGAVIVIGLYRGDLVYHLQALDELAESRVVAV